MTTGPVEIMTAALALAPERVCYAWICRRPDAFRAWCARRARSPLADPVATIGALFVLFKLWQVGVFAAWCAPDFWHWAFGASEPALWLGGVLVGVGQILNLSVFRRLGRAGVFYGSRFGHAMTWHHGFPFSLLRHPQYVGAVMSIWGLFLLLRAPSPDWYVLPTIETLYYVVAAYVEH